MEIIIMFSGLGIALSIYLGLKEIADVIQNKHFENHYTTHTHQEQNSESKSRWNPHAHKPYTFSHEEWMSGNEEYKRLYNEKIDEMAVRANEKIEKIGPQTTDTNYKKQP